MKRINFLKSMALLPLLSKTINASTNTSLSEDFSITDKMPLLFIGHGSPMNAIQENSFVQGFRELGENIQTPHAILCISAHWETKGTYVTAMENPKTIHDFGGFPQALFDVQYPALGSPTLAKQTQHMVQQAEVGLDDHWGLDHGTWSVLRHIYPMANIPVIQLSLDYTKPAQYHYQLAQELSGLRKKGILIIGSGNMVHNLRMVDRNRFKGEPFGYDWALEANAKMKSLILKEDFQSLIDYEKQGKAFQLAIPTPEHYLPLIYTLALKDKDDSVEFFNDAPIGGSLSMTSVQFS